MAADTRAAASADDATEAAAAEYEKSDECGSCGRRCCGGDKQDGELTPELAISALLVSVALLLLVMLKPVMVEPVERGLLLAAP